jgi:PAS domain S-box-containing protein
MVAYFAVNETTVAAVIALVERRTIRSVLLPTLWLSVLHWAGNLAIGFVAAVVAVAEPAALPLLLVPLVLSYFAYRARVEGQRERDQMRHLYEASRTLLTPMAAGSDLVGFLERVREMFDAEAAEAVVVDATRAVVHSTDGAPVAITIQAQEGDDAPSGPDAFIRVRPGLATHVAVSMGPDGERCALAVYRARDLSGSERAAFDALAQQLAVHLENRRLFAQTVEQRGELAEVIAHSSDGIFVVAPDRTILSWNPAMQSITGFGAAEALGRRCEEILWRSGPDGPGSAEPFELGTSEGDEGDEVDAQIVTKDGSSRWIRYTYTPVTDREGLLKSDVVVARDVTAEREADQLKTDFVATVSHELRTPLTPLKGFLHTLMEDSVEESKEARAEYYRIMSNQVGRLERLITDLLEVSSIESGAPVVNSHPIELSTLVGDQVDELAGQGGGRTVRFATPGVPVIVRADPFRVQQVVDNLLGNALKYSPDDTSIEVAIRLDGDEAVVAVRDEGEGIPPAEQDRVFDRFHRVDNGLTRRTGGTGLGLYIARRLVEAMGGRLWLVSAPGRGSTFSFSLPRHQGELRSVPVDLPGAAAEAPLEADARGA